MRRLKRRLAQQALALHLLQQRVQLDVQRHAGEPAGVVAEGRARRLAQVVQRAVDHVHVVDVQVDAAALQQVQQVRPRSLRQLPHRARLHGDVLRLRHVLQHRHRVARQLQDHRELRQRPVQLPHRLAHRLDVADAPELLRLAQVGVDHERDEAVRVRLRLQQRAVQPQLEAARPSTPRPPCAACRLRRSCRSRDCAVRPSGRSPP